MLFLKACVTVSWQEKGNLKAPTVPGCGAGGAGVPGEQGMAPRPWGQQLCCPTAPWLHPGMGEGEAVRLWVGGVGAGRGDAAGLQPGMEGGCTENASWDVAGME